MPSVWSRAPDPPVDVSCNRRLVDGHMSGLPSIEQDAPICHSPRADEWRNGRKNGRAGSSLPARLAYRNGNMYLTTAGVHRRMAGRHPSPLQVPADAADAGRGSEVPAYGADGLKSAEPRGGRAATSVAVPVLRHFSAERAGCHPLARNTASPAAVGYTGRKKS